MFTMHNLCFFLQSNIKLMINNAMCELIRPAYKGKWCLLCKVVQLYIATHLCIWVTHAVYQRLNHNLPE